MTAPNQPPADPTPAQREWMALGYGMFLHYGPNTIQGVGWGDGQFPAEKFQPRGLDIQQWADTAASAGMKYAVLTTKHHDGFCLWPSQHTRYSIANAPLKTDIVGEFVTAFRKAGLKVGLYYSLWDRNYPQYEDDAAYAEYMRAQITELLTGYGEILQVWFDGAWDKDHPTREWPFDPAWENNPNSGLLHGERWEWTELYNTIHRLQPNCMVLNNTSSDRPGGVRYLPIDARTAEHYDFVYNGKVCEPIVDPSYRDAEGRSVYLPLEFCTSLNPHWFHVEAPHILHASVETITGWYRTARRVRANLLLNVGPSMDGVIPEYHVHYLTKAARELGL